MSEVLKIEYKLAELPSAQHRAGLAGLVMMVRWLKRIGHEGICDVEPVTAEGAILNIDLKGLNALLAEFYAAQRKEDWLKKPKEKKPSKKKKTNDSQQNNDKKLIIPPLDTKNEKDKTLYLYERFLPKGSLIADLDPTVDKLWLKLWREFIYALLKQPASRYVFEYYEPNDEFRIEWIKRAENSRKKAIQESWEQLKGKKKSVSLAGTDFLGAQATNAEIVPFKDRDKYQFLLKFWVYAVQIYDPMYLGRNKDKEQPKSAGYAITIPDIAHLEYFCEEFPDALRESRGRNQKAHWYFKSRPDQAVINLAPSAGLDFLRILRKQLARHSRNLSDIILAVEICLLSISEDGKKNSIQELVRLVPQGKQLDEFARVRENCWDTFFVTQRLKNIITKRPWYFGFGQLCSSLKIEKIFDSKSFFTRDAKKSFELEVNDLNKVIKEQKEPLSLEALIYEMVGSYLGQKLASKFNLEWNQVKSDETAKKEYNEKRKKIAQETFYGFRSRSDTEFARYFALIFGSVQQSYAIKNSKTFEQLAQALYNDTEYVKSLTLLAISARS